MRGSMPLARLEHPKDGRADLVLAQPERRNATSIGLLEEAIRLIQGVGSDRSVLVIRGEGPHFCAGIDLDEVLESSEILGDDTPDVDVHLVRVAAGLGVRLARLPELRWRPDDELERPDPEARRRLSSLGAALRRREAVLGGLARALVARAAPALSNPEHQLPRWPLSAWCEAANLEMNAAFRVGRHAVFAAPRGIFRLDEITGDPATEQAPGS